MSNIPTNPNQEIAAHPTRSRCLFLARAAGASAVAVPALTLIASRKAHAGNAKKLTGLNAELIQEIMNDEASTSRSSRTSSTTPTTRCRSRSGRPPNLNMHG